MSDLFTSSLRRASFTTLSSVAMLPRRRLTQMEKELPQPQVVEALGLVTTNWAPARSS